MSCKPNPEDIAGGQAILEGVMMRHGTKIAAAVRRPDQEICFPGARIYSSDQTIQTARLDVYPGHHQFV